MKPLLIVVMLIKVLVLSSSIVFAQTYNEEFKCKFLKQGQGMPRPDSIRVFYNPLEPSKIDWSRPSYNETFHATNIFVHNDHFISTSLLEFGREPVRAVKVAANYPLALNYMRFIIFLDSVSEGHIVSGLWILTSKQSFFSEEVIIGKENLNCKRVN